MSDEWRRTLGRRARERGRASEIFGVPGEENLDVVESLRRSTIKLVAHPPRAGRGLHGRDAWAPHRQAGRLHHHARPGRAQSHHRRGLRAARRDADGDDHRPEGHPEPQAGALPDRRHRRDHDAADQDGAIRSSAPRPSRRWCARRSASRSRNGPARFISNCRKTSPRETAPDMSPIPPHPIELPVAPARGARPGGRADPERRAPADHAGRGGEPPAARGCAVGVRQARADSVLQHADGQGRRHRRVGPLHRHRGALGARLRASGDRPRGSHHRDRPRHDREAAVPHGSGRPDGDACRLSAGHCRAGVLPACRAHRRRRPQPRRCWPTGSKARLPRARRASAAARRRSSRRSPTARRKAASANAAAHRARRAPGDAGGRDRLPRQRHVQDLVRAQLPHPCRQHAAARQRARDDGRWAALGDHGRVPLSGAAACSRSAATAAS